jgi:hypothetical protein
MIVVVYAPMIVLSCSLIIGDMMGWGWLSFSGDTMEMINSLGFQANGFA